MREYIAEKKLRDGNVLRIITWISDTIRPGEHMYQLELSGNEHMSFPPDFHKYTENQIRDVYNFVDTTEEFENLALGIRN